MHHTIVRSAQSQADELEAAKARIRALEAQLRRIGVEPTTEAAYVEPSTATQAQGQARSFQAGNNHVTIQPGAGSSHAAAITAGATETKVRNKGKAVPTQPEPTKTVDDARLRMSLLELDK